MARLVCHDIVVGLWLVCLVRSTVACEVRTDKSHYIVVTVTLFDDIVSMAGHTNIIDQSQPMYKKAGVWGDTVTAVHYRIWWSSNDAPKHGDPSVFFTVLIVDCSPSNPTIQPHPSNHRLVNACLLVVIICVRKGMKVSCTGIVDSYTVSILWIDSVTIKLY